MDIKMLLCIVAISLIFIPLSREDWVSSTVSGAACLLSWVIIGCSWIVLGHPLVPGVVCLILCIVFYAAFDIPMFGDADILPIAFYAVIYLRLGFNSAAILIYPVCILLVMIPYGKVYGKMHGFEWKLGERTMLPVLPLMAVAWWLSGICWILFSLLV